MLKSIARTSALAALLALALSAPASAATRYVDDSGSDAGNNQCLTSGQPCKTVNYTLQQADSSDTVAVGGGTYAEQVTVGASALLSGTNFNPAVTSGPAVIDGGAGIGVTSTTDRGIRHLSLRGNGGGLRVTGGAPTISRIRFDDPQPISAGRLQIKAGSPIRVEDSTFAGVGGLQYDTGIYIEPGYKGSVTVAGSTLTNLNMAIWDSAGLNGASVLDMHDNTISVHGAPGNTLGGAVSSASSVLTARNNVVSGLPPGKSEGFNLNDAAATLRVNRLSGFDTAVHLFTPSNPVTMTGDLIVGNDIGISTSALTAPVTLTNETIVSKPGGPEIKVFSGALTVDSSIIGPGGIDGPACTITYSRGPTTSGNSCQQFQTAADPGFAGPGDYHLTAGSPLIDAGNPAAPPAGEFDFDGKARSLDGDGDCAVRRDMGAFEHAAAATCTPPPGGAGTGAGAGSGAGASTGSTPILDAPHLTGLRIAGRVRSARTATARYQLDRDASVSLRVERLLAGRKRGKRCVAIARRARVARSKRCTRALAVLVLKPRGHKGANAVKLPARLRGRALGAGSYRLVAVATENGRSSRPARRAFRVRAS